tara:strand:- start:1040 stop:1285 length:246 start_codon:yes stop_codon:yes gene_type:complete
MPEKRTSLSKNLELVTARMMNELVEAGADAVIVITTFTQRKRSKMSIRKVGNDLLCDSMLRHAFHLETIHYVENDGEEPDE